MTSSAPPSPPPPPPLTSPSRPENKPTTDALGTLQPKAPAGSARLGIITLSNGIKLEGRIWTTLNTPFRVWIEETKTYRDIDLNLIRRIDVQCSPRPWRTIGVGSRKAPIRKSTPAKRYPTVSLAYKFHFLNGQEIEGTIVAAVYFADAGKCNLPSTRSTRETSTRLSRISSTSRPSPSTARDAGCRRIRGRLRSTAQAHHETTPAGQLSFDPRPLR